MQPQDYFSANYLKDLEYFKSLNIGDHLCGRIYSSLFNNEDKLNFLNLKNFIICQYELNLINQVIYTHFRADFDEWKKIAPKMLDQICTYGSHPINILIFAERESKKSKNPIVFTLQEILSWDIYFKEYLEKICHENNFNNLTADGLLESVKNDPDCNSQEVKDYFEKKARNKQSR